MAVTADNRMPPTNPPKVLAREMDDSERATEFVVALEEACEADAEVRARILELTGGTFPGITGVDPSP
ncbi:hypothetical protein AB0B54_28590 [Microbispora bryophytorum]|uniref:hypothetical protein n=1 Tax=Microbispora bryophytorum TaxID=1460882 RepID=UPI0033D47755